MHPVPGPADCHTHERQLSTARIVSQHTWTHSCDDNTVTTIRVQEGCSCVQGASEADKEAQLAGSELFVAGSCRSRCPPRLLRSFFSFSALGGISLISAAPRLR